MPHRADVNAVLSRRMTPMKIPYFRKNRSLAALAIAGLLAFQVSLLAGGCATTGINSGQLNMISLNEEWQMGQQLEQELSKKVRLVNDATALSYIRKIGNNIVNQTELGNAPWEFHIIADPEINAFNIPGGQVYVNTGLIMAADNTAELAGVMAHEISHGVARHSTERMSKVYGLDVGLNYLLGQNPSMLKQIAAQLAAGGVVAKFSRDDEREADRLGVQYMYQAGYNPEGMATMFEELLATRKRRPSSVEQFLSTHPLAEDRIRAVRQQARTLPRRSGLIMNDGGLKSVQQRVTRFNA
jgi:predicted Zn-dependent protease